MIITISSSLKVSAIGDVLGGAVSSPLDPLITLPMGCGEQTTAAMVPLITAIEHLQVCGDV